MADTYSTLGDLSLSSPISSKYIKAVEVWEEVNCHGTAEIILIPSTILSGEDILKLEKSAVILDTKDGVAVFHGVVESVTARNANDYQEITLFATTLTASHDLKPESAVFQDDSKTLSDITALLSGLTVNLSDDLTIEEILFQNKETNFAFNKRIAHEYGQFLMIDCKTTGNPVYMGNDPIQTKTLGEYKLIHMKKKIYPLERSKANVDDSISAYQFAQTHLEIQDISMGVGCQLTYEEQEMLVVSSHITSEQGGLQNHIALVGIGGQTPTEKIHPPRGFITLAEVKAVENNTVQVEFFETSDTMLWLPYENTVHDYCYAMPDVGDMVYVYHHPENTERTMAFSSKFMDNSDDDFNTYTTRSLTSENCLIQFEKEAMHLTGNRSDFEKKGTECISLKDSGGILVSSAENVTLESEDDLIIFAGSSHSGMAVPMGTGLATSVAGYVQLLAGVGFALGVPAVAIPSTEVATSMLASQSAGSMAGDLKSTLSGMDETMTEGNSSTDGSDGKLSILSDKEVKLVVEGTSLHITTSKFDLTSDVVMM